MISNIENCKLIDLKTFSDARGDLVFIENGNDFNFNIKRNYVIFNVPKDQQRGFHAHKKLHQLVMCLSGKFTIELFDGFLSKEFILNSPSKVLYICPMIWREMRNFSEDAVCSVLASDIYDKSDYINDKYQFIQMAKDRKLLYSE